MSNSNQMSYPPPPSGGAPPLPPQAYPAYQPPPQGAGGYYQPPQQSGGYYQPPQQSGGYYQPSQETGGYYQQPQGGYQQWGQQAQVPPPPSEPVYPPVYTPYGAAEYGGQEPWKGDVSDFADKSLRMGFLRKVYAILSLQLLATFGCVALFLYDRNLNMFVRTHSWTMWVAFGLTFVLLMVLTCYEDMRRRSPHNYILLAAFTLCEAYLVAVCTSFYNINQVLMAIGITMVCTLALTAFAFQTKIDFTMSSGVLMCALMCLMMFGFLMIFFKSKIIEIVYCSLASLVFMVFIIYDTQTMIGGDHEMAISPEEYVFAALSLYMDIINLFLNILRLVAAASDNNN